MTVHTAISINFQWALLMHIFCGLWWITDELQKPLYLKAISFFELVPKSAQDFRKQQNNLFKKKYVLGYVIIIIIIIIIVKAGVYMLNNLFYRMCYKFDNVH